MINLERHRDDFNRARSRAAELEMRVKQLATDGVLFHVGSSSMSDVDYLVEIVQTKDGALVASCGCVAGQRSLVCIHVAAACETLIATSQAVWNLIGDERKESDDDNLSA